MPDPDSTALLEMLSQKSMLLSGCEQEIRQLRQERGRSEAWLSVFNRLSFDVSPDAPTPLLAAWTAAMLEDLSYQVAAVYASEREGGPLLLLASVAPAPLPEEMRLEATALAFLAESRSGSCAERASHPLQALADAAGLERFFWHTFSGRDQRLLLIAGYAQGAAERPGLDERDHRSFVLLGNYLAALLNIALIAELERERTELSASNTQLGSSLTRLREAQSKLLESTKVLAEVSRRAGMADVATGVLHNVGNTLNSVNVSAGLAAERLRRLKISGLSRLAELVERNVDDLPGFLASEDRQRTLPAYLKELHRHLSEERNAIAAELRTLQDNVEHIKSIVNKQQQYATSLGVFEACLPSQVMEDALGLNEHSLAQAGILIVRDYQSVPELVLDRHRILQILVNLLSNAKHALVAARQQQRQLRAYVCLRGGSVQLGIEDNGVGVAPEHLGKLFSHGFTTRQGGHGFGLHTSALAARDMGGSLTCASGGRDQGATFVLTLPARAPERAP